MGMYLHCALGKKFNFLLSGMCEFLHHVGLSQLIPMYVNCGAFGSHAPTGG
jgi:hypothetical protein